MASLTFPPSAVSASPAAPSTLRSADGDKAPPPPPPYAPRDRLEESSSVPVASQEGPVDSAFAGSSRVATDLRNLQVQRHADPGRSTIQSAACAAGAILCLIPGAVVTPLAVKHPLSNDDLLQT